MATILDLVYYELTSEEQRIDNGGDRRHTTLRTVLLASSLDVRRYWVFYS